MPWHLAPVSGAASDCLSPPHYQLSVHFLQVHAQGAKGWCVVGDDPIELEQDAIDHFSDSEEEG